jgi:hypothetical protein
MPWKVFKEGDKFCLHKMNSDGSKGATVHCHDSAEMARRQQAALYVSENKELSPEDVIILDEEGLEYKESTEKGWGTEAEMPAYASGARSLEELDAERAARERVNDLANLTSDFQSIMGNIVYTPLEYMDTSVIDELDNVYEEFKSRASKLISEPLDDEETKAKREDVSPADKKRAVAEYGNVTYADPENKKYPIDTSAHIHAAWSYIRMPKNAAKYPDKGAAIKRRIISAWKKKIDPKGPPAAKETFLDKVIKAVKDAIFVQEPEKSNMMIWKEVDEDEYGWMATYSNKFMDRDNPPDIIASEAHQKFVEKVDKGLAPLPDLYLWHIPEWKIGYATALAYDDSGFPIAIGRFDKECQDVAEWLEKQEDFGVSHGMWNKTIQRDPEDPSVIIAYETHEISALPRDHAANLLADWSVIPNDIKELEEVTMTIPEEKRQELLERGLPEQTLSALEERNKKKAETAEAEGVKSKETEEATAVPEATQEADSTESVPETEKPVEKKDAEASEFPTRQEVAEAVANVVAPVVEDLKSKFEELTNKYDEAMKQLAEFKESDDKRIKEIVQMTPRDSLASLMLSRFTERASTSKQTKVGENDSLLKKQPREEESKEEVGGTGIRFIDKMTHGK